MSADVTETVVDVDLHLDGFLERNELASYLEEPHRSHIRTSTEFAEASASSISGQWEIYGSADLDPPSYADFEEFYGTHVADSPVDSAVVNAFSQLGRRPNLEYASALMEATNDLLLDRFLDEYENLYGLAELAPRRPDRAAEELDRLGNEEAIVGAIVGNTGTTPSLGDPKYDVVYRAAEDNDLPIAVHPDATHSFEEEFPFHYQGFQSYFGVHSLAGPWSHMLTMSDLIEKGTVEKFPDLDFLFLEMDFTLVPYLTYRMNTDYGMRSKQLPLLDRDPEKYVRESYYYGTHPLGTDPDVVETMIDLVGADRLLFATGAPEYDRDTVERFDDLLGERLSAEDRQRVLCENAVDLFGIDV